MSTHALPSTGWPHRAGTPADAVLPWRTLAWLTLVVLVAHGVLLGGLPSLLPSWRLAGDDSTQAFTTRTIALPAPAAVQEAPVEQAAPAETTATLQEPAPVSAATVLDEIPPAPLAAPASIAPDSIAAASMEPLPPPGEGGEEAYGVAGLADESTPLALLLPNPARLKYDVKGEIKNIPYSANAELLWNHDDKTYNARLQISHWLASRTQTSRGTITSQGLEPIRFGDKVRSEVAAHFEREKGKVSFSANSPDVPLTAGAQDQLSVFVQLAALFGGNPGRLTPGVVLSFQAIGPRSAENWIFKVGGSETVKLPGGDIPSVKVTRDALGENDARAELWLAPSLGYLPVRIRLTQGNSDFVDQLWRSTQIP